jgi:F420-0:gamma-glutamyl ligase-like protein
MAEVTSGSLTVIVLNEDETDALVDLLYMHLPEHADDTVLDELVNSMIGRPESQKLRPTNIGEARDMNWRYSGGDWVRDGGEDNG